jgi:hypothetical protein
MFSYAAGSTGLRMALISLALRRLAGPFWSVVSPQHAVLTWYVAIQENSIERFCSVVLGDYSLFFLLIFFQLEELYFFNYSASVSGIARRPARS